MTIGLVTCSKLPALTPSEQLLIPLFARHNINANALVWSDETINWCDYDYLIFRSIWDSHLNPAAFSNWLQHLKNINAKTFNPVDTVQFNQHKFYLKYLEEKGVAIIPTLFIEKTGKLNLSELKSNGWQKAVIKPAISASAYLTELFMVNDLQRIEEKYADIAVERDLLVQQFMPQIQSFGELSLVFFNKKYAHTVLKTAKDKDFRVQYEYGGQTKTFYPDKRVIETAEKIVALFDENILYARVDGVVKNHELVVMEIELIEPELFFEYGVNAREKFVEATVELINKQ
jgi:glutathione synthase/RimK-type ligase-like ATP-grasp enzyme